MQHEWTGEKFIKSKHRKTQIKAQIFSLALHAAVALRLFGLYAYFCCSKSGSYRRSRVSIFEILHFIPFTVAVDASTVEVIDTL